MFISSAKDVKFSKLAKFGIVATTKAVIRRIGWFNVAINVLEFTIEFELRFVGASRSHTNECKRINGFRIGKESVRCNYWKLFTTNATAYTGIGKWYWTFAYYWCNFVRTLFLHFPSWNQLNFVYCLKSNITNGMNVNTNNAFNSNNLSLKYNFHRI